MIQLATVVRRIRAGWAGQCCTCGMVCSGAVDESVDRSARPRAHCCHVQTVIRQSGCRSGDGQMLQELDTLRRRCAQQEAQLSTQEQIILSLNDHAGGGGGSAGGAADAGRKPSTPQQAQPVEEQRAASSAGTDQDVEAGGAEAGAASDEADDDVGT